MKSIIWFVNYSSRALHAHTKYSNSRWFCHWFIIGNKKLLSGITCWCVFYSVHINQWSKINFVSRWINFLVGTSSIYSRTASKKQIYFPEMMVFIGNIYFNFTVGFQLWSLFSWSMRKILELVKCHLYSLRISCFFKLVKAIE